MHQIPRPPKRPPGLDSPMLYQPVAWQPLRHVISSNPAVISTGHSYAAPCSSTRDASTTQSKLLITIPSHSRSVFPVDAEKVTSLSAFIQVVVFSAAEQR